MANHQPKSDPFAKVTLIIGLALILLTVLILVNSLINTIKRNSIDGEIDTSALVANKSALTAANLQAIGEVATSDGAGAAPTAARSGEDVYKAVCAACHDTGAANAPKLDDKAAWEPRVATGFDALMNTAVKGKGAMPARGGQNVPDGELKAAIAYMTTTAGFSLDIPKDEAATAPEATDTATEAKPEEAPAGTEAETAQPAATTEAPESGTSTPSTPEAATTPEAIEAPAGTEAETAQPAATTEAPESGTSAPSAPEAATAPSTPEAIEAPSTPSVPTAPDAVEAPSTPEAPATNSEAPAPSAAESITTSTVAAAATTAAVAATTTEAVAEAPKSGADGKAIYKQTCFACHDMGIAGAPKIGDKALWASRIATGNDAMYESALKGKTSPAGAMPPKGGNMSLSDDEVKAAVDYMVNQSQ